MMGRSKDLAAGAIVGAIAVGAAAWATLAVRRRRRRLRPVLVGQACRPLRLILVRHGESEANVNRTITTVVPDPNLHLTLKGREQALEAGCNLKSIIGSGSVHFIVSPYVRTWETFNGISQAWGGPNKVAVRDEPLIREQDFGNFDHDQMAECHQEKHDFGQFYYRFPEGESPADVYNRASIFMETLYRRWEHSTEENLVIVTHGMFTLVWLMRFLRYGVSDYSSFDSIRNCELIVLERPASSLFYQLTYTWSPGKEPDRKGLRRKHAEEVAGRRRAPPGAWSGAPDEAPLVSAPTRTSNRDLNRRPSKPLS
jgi:broad specificity phosphatase PhoE